MQTTLLLTLYLVFLFLLNFLFLLPDTHIYTNMSEAEVTYFSDERWLNQAISFPPSSSIFMETDSKDQRIFHPLHLGSRREGLEQTI